MIFSTIMMQVYQYNDILKHYKKFILKFLKNILCCSPSFSFQYLIVGHLSLFNKLIVSHIFTSYRFFDNLCYLLETQLYSLET